MDAFINFIQTKKKVMRGLHSNRADHRHNLA